MSTFTIAIILVCVALPVLFTVVLGYSLVVVASRTDEDRE